MEDIKLPDTKITQQQQNFLLQIFVCKKGQSEAYRIAYNCEKAKDSTIWSEASKLLKNPKVAPWVEYYNNNQQETIKNEVNYTITDAFEEFQEIQNRAMENTKTLPIAVKAVENKAKLKGLYKEDNQQKALQVTAMGTVTVDSKALELNVGKKVEDSEQEDTP